MSPEQEAPQLVTIKQMAESAGIDTKNRKDFEVFCQRFREFRRKNPTIIPDKIDGRRHFYSQRVADRVVNEIAGPIRRTTGALTDDTEDWAPQKHDFTTLSQADLLERSNKQRENNRSKRQAQNEKEKKAETIKQQMPIYFTNEVLEHILGSTLHGLNRSVRLALGRALIKINAGNDNTTIGFIFEGKSENEIKQFFISKFISTLEKGFNNKKNPQGLSEQEIQLVAHCTKLKKLENVGWSRSTIINGVCRHFDIPEELLDPLRRLNSQKI